MGVQFSSTREWGSFQLVNRPEAPTVDHVPRKFGLWFARAGEENLKPYFPLKDGEGRVFSFKTGVLRRKGDGRLLRSIIRRRSVAIRSHPSMAATA